MTVLQIAETFDPAVGGWTQVTAELALERAGPERYLSSHMLLEALIDHAGPAPEIPIGQQPRRHADLASRLQKPVSGKTGMTSGQSSAPL